MKWIINIVLISTLLTGCYVRHPANDVGIEVPREIERKKTCIYDSLKKRWRCYEERRWKI